MKKTTLLFALALLALPTQEGTAQQPTPISIGGGAKVGLIVTGTGNTINTTQIFGKSPEYAELKKRLDGLQAAIAKKADDCEQMRRDSLPAKYRDNCRAELIALNAKRDSVQKIEARTRQEIIQTAEYLQKIPINSRRLFAADSLFKEGKIREAQTLLNFKEITQEGDALLAKRERDRRAVQEDDSLLVDKS